MCLPSFFLPCTRKSSSTSSMATVIPTIKVGDRLPDANLSYFDKEGNLQRVSISRLCGGKNLALFAFPGAFTPMCSQSHLPGIIRKADQLRAKGVDVIACVSVNDVFVLKAWADSVGVDEDKVLMLSDGNCRFTEAMGVAVDLSDKPFGLGTRSRRYALLAKDGIVRALHLEEGPSFTTFAISGADNLIRDCEQVFR